MLFSKIILLVDIPLQRSENTRPRLQNSPAIPLQLAQLFIPKPSLQIRLGDSTRFGDCEKLQFLTQDDDCLF